MLTIGICGASGSGKTTLAEALCDQIEGRAVLITQDAYYRDHPHLSFAEREQLNYDEPGIFEHDQLLEDVKTIKAGGTFPRKAYDFANHCRADTDEPVSPGDVLIIEGIHTFYDARLREEMDFKIYVSVDPDICLLRRMQRDILERGRSVDRVGKQYLATVKPMYERWIRGYIEFADLIVAGGGKNAKIADILAFYINNGMGTKS